MKRLGVTILAAIALSACEGPMGPAGHDGVDGLDGKDGINANVACLTCHVSTNMTAKTTQYELSKHFTGNTSARNGKYCARCHTNDGFIEITSQDKYVGRNRGPAAL